MRLTSGILYVRRICVNEMWRDAGKVTRRDPYKAGGVQLLPPGQVSDVVPVVVDALHAAFEVLPASAHRFAAVRHPSET